MFIFRLIVIVDFRITNKTNNSLYLLTIISPTRLTLREQPGPHLPATSSPREPSSRAAGKLLTLKPSSRNVWLLHASEWSCLCDWCLYDWCLCWWLFVLVVICVIGVCSDGKVFFFLMLWGLVGIFWDCEVIVKKDKKAFWWWWLIKFIVF